MEKEKKIEEYKKKVEKVLSELIREGYQILKEPSLSSEHIEKTVMRMLTLISIIRNLVICRAKIRKEFDTPPSKEFEKQLRLPFPFQKN